MLFTPGLWVPLVNIQNTYILPGIPRLFQQMVEAHAGRFQGPAAHERVLYTNLGEGGRARGLHGARHAGGLAAAGVGTAPPTPGWLPSSTWLLHPDASCCSLLPLLQATSL